MTTDDPNSLDPGFTQVTDREQFNVDKVLDEVVGPAGKWQWFIVLYVMLTTPGFPTFPVFANSAPPHRCAMEPSVEQFIQNHSLSFSLVASRLAPVNSSEGGADERVDSGCERYAFDWEIVDLKDIFFGSELHMNNTELCPFGYVFKEDDLYYPGSVVKEFGTVCNQSWLVPTGTSVYMFGMLLGFIGGGWFGDYIGRRKVLWLFSCLEFGASIAVSLSPNFSTYVVFRALVGIGNTVKMSVGNVLVMEITTARYRSLFGAILALGMDFIFRALMALYAYLLPNWRLLNLALMSTSVFGIFYITLLPESPRWLISQGNYRAAVEQLHTACLMNHRKDNTMRLNYLKRLSTKAIIWEQDFKKTQQISKVYDVKGKLTSWRRFPRDLILNTILATLVVFVIVMCFYGILLYTSNLVGSIYLLGFISSLTGIPSTMCAAILYRVFVGRKSPFMFVLFTAAVVLALSALNDVIVTPVDDLVLTICANFALVFITIGVCMVYVYVPELFPSSIRTCGFGLVFGLSRLGSMLCPYVNELDRTTKHGTPLLIYSGSLVVVVLLITLLPNTDGRDLANFVNSQTEVESASFPTLSNLESK